MFHVKHAQYDVVVVGGGHAGCEAAHAAARMGGRVALVTLDPAKIGVMSCNPAIGGLGKGHIVREIDAMGGIMAKAADASGIQFRLLNRRKGPAVQGPRAQSDRALYKVAIQKSLREQPNVGILAGEVVDFVQTGDRVKAVTLADGTVLPCMAVVLTTGTFLGGVIHIGHDRHDGGRMGESAVTRLAHRLRDLGLRTGRLKTGTPPRLDGRTIDWDRLDTQPGDEDPAFFSFATRRVAVRQVACGITHTNARTHDIIRENLAKSAMYGGAIDGVGPRYCPSIEDKIVRFAEKEAHQVFLEPEGLKDHTVYPNGISTSLPREVQADYVRSMVGLERAEIVQPGYAIEYDYSDPRGLTSALQVPEVQGLYLAGQINGTTGYEEAAAQGLTAGMNALKSTRDEGPVVLSRVDAYIGVMIDDLTTKGVSEPYRMFTSRAEYRLSLRADNADQRLTPLAQAAGLIPGDQWAAFSAKLDRLTSVESRLAQMSITPKAARAAGIEVKEDGQKRTGMELLAFPDVSFEDLEGLNPSLADVDTETRVQLNRQALYQSYIERQKRDVDALNRDANWTFPPAFDFASVTGLSSELRAKLSAVRPESIAQAGRIEGMTPAATMLLLARLKHDERRAS
ncbi:MAG: tRNA uridine-5-carboxymethylaminomethyl(34) synthesis enzyme MnmG [Pseudomonadota bacterium]